MKLHLNSDDFKDLLQLTSKHFGLPESFIEKDYWIMRALKNLSNSEFRDLVIFKGGTSLSKVYKVIKRFSEDIDLTLTSNACGARGLIKSNSQKAAQKVKNSIIPSEFVGIEDPLNNQNPKMYKRVFSFPAQHSYSQGIHDKIVLEITALSDPTPFTAVKLGSLIGEFLLETNRAEIIAEFELDTVDINVLCIERTFCEKVLAIRKAAYVHFAEGKLDFFQNRVRHLYDIAHLIKHEKVIALLNDSKAFHGLIEKCIKDDWSDEKNETNVKFDLFSLKKETFFSSPEKLLNQLERSYYNLRVLTFDQIVPDMAEVKNALSVIYQALP